MSVLAVTWRCDRCGGTQPTSAAERPLPAPYPRHWRRGRIPEEQPAKPSAHGKDFDLCQRCSSAFSDWWGEGGREK